MSKIQEAKKLLKQYFGYDEFRQGQEQLIEAALNGQDVLGIMPTGAGKSLCFQIPALMMDGITLVISPLISLMKDQVGTLRAVWKFLPGVRLLYALSGRNRNQQRRPNVPDAAPRPGRLVQDHLCGTRTLGNRRFYQFCAK